MIRNMMMTQPNYGGNDFDVFHRPTDRTMSNGSYYDRAVPYNAYYEPRHELRQEYPGRVPMHAMINEPEQPDVAGGPARRRIAVACARCRRRKIKCSGDPGDGSGCNACKTSGANTQDCNFTRVSSYQVPFKGAGTSVDMLPAVSSSNAPAMSTNFGMEPSSAASSTFPPPATYSGHQRPSLPTLHTPASYSAGEYEQPYDNSPLEAYTYGSSTIPRQDSYASSYGSQESYRSFSAAPHSAPATAPFYEQHGTYSFGNLQAPAPGRLPSVTADTMSSLNMDSLHSTLPLNTPTERTLPAPYTISYPTQTWSSQPRPDLRPFDPPTFRPHINGIHSRNAMGWSPDGMPSLHRSIALQQQTVLPPPQLQQQQYQQLPTCSFPNNSSTSSAQDTSGSQILGYQFAPSASYSPDVSPISAPDNYPSSTSTSSTATLPPSTSNVSTSSSATQGLTMLPPSHHGLRYTSSSASLPTLAEAHYSSTLNSAPTSRHHEAAASLYSFSTESSTAPSGEAQPHQQQQNQQQQQQVQVQVQQQRPHHAASHDGLRRQSQMGEFEGRRVPTHRNSARSLHERRDV